jgi:hypothetical protein
MTQPHYIDLKPCPFCGEALTVGGGVNPYGRCETPDCWMADRRISISIEVPAQGAAWNRRPAPMEAVPTRCQKCGGEIQGWTCHGCGQVFRENDAGALVFAPMEAVAWGCFDANGLDDKLVYRDRRRAEDAAFAFTPSMTVQALAVIPTQGEGQ